MRVPDSLTYNKAIRYMNEAKGKLDNLSAKVSSTKNFQNSSDDPSLVSASLVLRSSVQVSEGYIKASQNTQSWMENSEIAYGLMNDLFTESNSIMLKGLSDSMGASERANDLAIQIGQILNQAISIANTSVNDNYIFAGHQVKTKPFSLAADGSTVDYSGDSGQMKRDLAPGVTITMNSDGETALTPFFDALILAKSGLETNNRVDMNTALSDINSALATMNQSRLNNGALLRQVKTGIEHLESTKLELKSLLSIKEDANMAEAISMFNLQETTYKTVLEVGSRTISSLNLFDILN